MYKSLLKPIVVAMEVMSPVARYLTFIVGADCHEIFGPGQNLVRPDKICQHIWSAPATNGPTRSAYMHAFRSVKARVAASETAREMCADENEDLVEKACLYLFDGRYPECSTSNEKRVIRRKAATLTLRDGEVFYKKTKKNSTGQKVNVHIARSVCMHALMTSIKQEVFEVRYVRSSEERCRILKACHVDLTSGHMGVKRTSHRVLERFFWKGVIKDIEIMVSVE